MDILQIVKPKKIFIKASFHTLSFSYKFGVLILVISMASLLLPAQAMGAELEGKLPMVFTQGDHTDYLTNLSDEAMKRYRVKRLETALYNQRSLAGAVAAYLRTYNSPLVDHAEAIVKTANWKKIVALANAESSLCRKYPIQTNNCWGVGGSNLWTMGNNLTEAVAAMDDFLINHPKSWETKYAEMTFEQMNGLYKQPPGDHWIYNNQIIYDDLVEIEQSI
jgi:hypothetical protein